MVADTVDRQRQGREDGEADEEQPPRVGGPGFHDLGPDQPQRGGAGAPGAVQSRAVEKGHRIAAFPAVSSR